MLHFGLGARGLQIGNKLVLVLALIVLVLARYLKRIKIGCISVWGLRLTCKKAILKVLLLQLKLSQLNLEFSDLVDKLLV